MKTRISIYGLLIGFLSFAKMVMAQGGFEGLEMIIEPNMPGIEVCLTYLRETAPCAEALDPVEIGQELPAPDKLTDDPEWVGSPLPPWGGFLGKMPPPPPEGTDTTASKEAFQREINMSPTPTVWQSYPDCLPPSPCFDIASGEMYAPNKDEQAALGHLMGQIPEPITQFAALWNALQQPPIASTRPTFNAPIDARFCKQEWTEMVLTGDQHYNLDLVSSVEGVATLYTYGDSTDWSTYVVVARRTFGPDTMVTLPLNGIRANRPVVLMIATELSAQGKLRVGINPGQIGQRRWIQAGRFRNSRLPLTAKPPKSPPPSPEHSARR